MIVLLLLSQTAEPPPMPTDWAVLAPLPYVEPPRMTPQLTGFVASEIAARRCPAPALVEGHYVLKVEVATLVGADGVIRRTVPHAINCPAVEQYAAGLVAGFARSNLPTRPSATDTWYRATIVFDWQG